jgi:hypothetical protein
MMRAGWRRLQLTVTTLVMDGHANFSKMAVKKNWQVNEDKEEDINHSFNESPKEEAPNWFDGLDSNVPGSLQNFVDGQGLDSSPPQEGAHGSCSARSAARPKIMNFPDLVAKRSERERERERAGDQNKKT